MLDVKDNPMICLSDLVINIAIPYVNFAFLQSCFRLHFRQPYERVFFSLLQHNTLEALLERGEKIDDLVARSEGLSMQSKAFYQTVSCFPSALSIFSDPTVRDPFLTRCCTLPDVMRANFSNCLSFHAEGLVTTT